MRATNSIIKSQIFKSISNNKLNKSVLEKEFILIKEKRDKKMNNYKELEPTMMIETERNMTLEKANMVLLQYYQGMKMCDLYSKRAQIFMNCVIALETDNVEEYEKQVLEFAEEVKKQALEYKKMEINESKQKRITLNATRTWLRVLEQEDYSKWKASIEREEIQKEIVEEDMKFFLLGEEEDIIKKNIDDVDMQIKLSDFDTMDLLDCSPLISVGKIYPNIKNEFLDLNEQRAKISK